MSQWEQIPLGELASIELGKTPPRKDQKCWDPGKATDNVWLSISDLPKTTLASVSTSKEHVSNEGAKVCKIVKEGTLLVSFKLTLGRLAFAGRDLFTNEAIAALTLQDDAPLGKNYLYWYLTYFDWDSAAEGSEKVKGKTLNKAKLKEFPVLIPSLLEQERIVSILDEAFEAIDTAIANTEKNLSNTEELLASHKQNFYVSQEASFEKATLGEVCEFFNGKAHEKSIDAEGAFKVVNSKFISSDGAVAKKCAQQMFPLYQNDIVMVMSDVPNGKALAKCLIIDEDDRYTLNQRICAIRTSRLETKYLFHQLNRHPYLLAFNNGENQTNLRKGDILNCPLAIPPIDEQERISEAMDSFDAEVQNLIDNFNEKLLSLNTLKQSVLEKAFAGELTDSVLEEAGV